MSKFIEKRWKVENNMEYNLWKSLCNFYLYNKIYIFIIKTNPFKNSKTQFDFHWVSLIIIYI